MTIKPTSFRLSDSILDRLRRLAHPAESSASVIARALTALEATERGQAAPPPLAPGLDTASRVDALEARIAALEERSASSATSCATGSAERSASVARQPVAQCATRSASPHSNPGYPDEVKRLAVQMAADGYQPVQIRAAMMEQCGRAPDSKNIAKLISGWREKLNSENQ